MAILLWLLTCAGLAVALVARDEWQPTMLVTETAITELGDGSYAVEIHPEALLEIGETGTVRGLAVTVNRASRVGPAENIVGEWEFWSVEFTAQSTANAILFGLNPVVDTQVQYLRHPDAPGSDYTWEMPENRDCSPEVEVISDGLAPKDSFTCNFEYVLPADERNLHWVYERTARDPRGSYLVQNLVWKMR